MTNPLRPEALLQTAERLATPIGRGRPLQLDLRRAVSTAYYAVFHALAIEYADQVVGKANRNRIRRAWGQAYRSIEHARVKSACTPTRKDLKAAYRRFPPGIRAFGDPFVALQKKRQEADYDPLSEPLLVSEVMAEIATARRAIDDFQGSAAEDRRAFCIFVTHNLRA